MKCTKSTICLLRKKLNSIEFEDVDNINVQVQIFSTDFQRLNLLDNGLCHITLFSLIVNQSTLQCFLLNHTNSHQRWQSCHTRATLSTLYTTFKVMKKSLQNHWLHYEVVWNWSPVVGCFMGVERGGGWEEGGSKKQKRAQRRADRTQEKVLLNMQVCNKHDYSRI